MELAVSSSRIPRYLFPQQSEMLALHKALWILQTVYKDNKCCATQSLPSRNSTLNSLSLLNFYEVKLFHSEISMSNCSFFSQIQQSLKSPDSIVLEAARRKVFIYNWKDWQEDIQRQKKLFWNNSGLSTSKA